MLLIRTLIPLLLCASALCAQEWRILAIRVDFPFEETDESTTTGRGSFDLRSVEEAGAEYDLPYDLPPHDRTYFEHHLEALGRYYDVVSEGRVDIKYEVYPRGNEATYTLPESMLYYGNGRSGEEIGQRWVQLLRDALVLAQADPEGPNLNEFNSFLIFHAGIGHETGALNDIRSVFLQPRDFDQYNGGALQIGEVQIDQAWILPESPGTFGRGGLNGLMAKFFGHQLGLPGMSNFAGGLPAVGGWSLMDVGANALGFVRRDSLDAVVGFVAPHPMAWSKIRLGWIEPLEVVRDTVVSVLATDRAGALPKAIRIPIDDTEYFLLENRQRRGRQGAPVGLEVVGADADEISWIEETQVDFSGGDWGVWLGVDEYDAFIPGSGLLIWHVDEQVIAERPEGGMNNDPVLQGIALEEADGYRDIGRPVFERLRQIEGHQDDPFYKGGSSLFGRDTKPSTRSNDGWATGIEVEVLSDNADVLEVAIRFTRQQIGWPRGIIDGRRLQASDIDGDGQVELLVEDAVGLHYAEWDSGLAEWSVEGGRFLASGDLDGDGRDELFVQRSEMVEAWRMGDEGPLWKRELSGEADDALFGLFSRVGGNPEPTLALVVSGAVLELDARDGAIRAAIDRAGEPFLSLYGNGDGFSGIGDGALDAYGQKPLPAMWGQEDAVSRVFVAGAAGAVLVGDQELVLGDSLLVSPALGDVDGDGLLEGVFPGASSLHIIDGNGVHQADFPVALPDYAQAGPTQYEPILADIDGRGDQEILVVGHQGIYALTGQGALVSGFPLLMSETPMFSPAVADFDGDGLLEVAALGSSLLYGWELGAVDPGFSGTAVDWGQADGGAAGMRFVRAEGVRLEGPVDALLAEDEIYCYPNPVGGGQRVHMRFFLMETASVEIVVYDALGAEVERINADGHVGENDIAWSVETYASGIYLCKIQAKTPARSASALVKMAVHQ